MIILGIETSCDETGIALYDTEKKILLAESLYSQIEQHAQYGGVVPELASRDHISKITPLLDECLNQAKINITDITAIAYTATPGLVGALMVGAGFAKSLAFSLGIKSIAIHHLEGHILACFLDNKNKISFPFCALLVSGGHTQLINAKSLGVYEVLGRSIDDAAGEAFDKTAKMMGLPYPGGPYLSKLAKQGVSGKYLFPRPMTSKPGLDFSFSGLKTAVLNVYLSIAKSKRTIQLKADIAIAFQEALVDTILIKCKRAIKQTKSKHLILAGGVAANEQLRESLKKYSDSQNINIFYPEQKYCTDNGAMIAIAGGLHLENDLKKADDDLIIKVSPRSSLEKIR